MRKYALFTGCQVPVRALEYEVSARRVAEALSIDIVLLEGASCCGFPISFLQQDSSMALAAINLCLAEEMGLPIVTFCNSCTSHLAKTNHYLKSDPEIRERVQELLEPTGLTFKGTTEVKHVARIFYEEVGPENIKKKVENSLEGLRIAPLYGCHYLKPTSAHDRFDEPEDPRSLEALIAATGAKPVDYPERILCCGGPILAIDEESTMSMARRALDGAKRGESDAGIVICPFCNVMFNEYQQTIGEKFGVEYDIPIFFLPQILGLALGFSPRELRIKKRSSRYKGFFKKMEGGNSG